MGKVKQLYVGILIAIIAFVACNSEDMHQETRAGHYKVTKVEYSYYSDSLTTPDSVVVYENDTLGYFNFYHSDPPKLYIDLHFPSRILLNDFNAKWYVHDEDQHIMVIHQLVANTWVNYKYYVDEPKKNKQTWTFTEDFFNGKVIVEKIWVEKK